MSYDRSTIIEIRIFGLTLIISYFTFFYLNRENKDDLVNNFIKNENENKH